MNIYATIIRRSVLFLCATLAVLGVSYQGLRAQTITQGYEIDQPIQIGMIVRLKADNNRKVEALTQQDADEIQGVVVSPDESPVSLSTVNVDQEAFVATYGKHVVLVSTQNGSIKTGDFIAVSSLDGIGMKANKQQKMVVGKALGDFDGQKSSEGSAELKTSSGTRIVSLGRIPVEIGIGHNPLYEKNQVAKVPEFLRKTAQAVSNREVSAFRIYASILVLIVCIIVGGVILVVGVRSSMTAVGRNPLAKKSIIRSLIQVTLISLIIFVIGVIAVYLLLRV